MTFRDQHDGRPRRAVDSLRSSPCDHFGWPKPPSPHRATAFSGSVSSARATSSRLRSCSVSAEAALPLVVEGLAGAAPLGTRAAPPHVSVAEQRADEMTFSSTVQCLEWPATICGRPMPRRDFGRGGCRRCVRLEGDAAAFGREHTPAIHVNSVVLPSPFGRSPQDRACGTAKLTRPTADEAAEAFASLPRTVTSRAHERSPAAEAPRSQCQPPPAARRITARHSDAGEHPALAPG